VLRVNTELRDPTTRRERLFVAPPIDDDGTVLVLSVARSVTLSIVGH